MKIRWGCPRIKSTYTSLLSSISVPVFADIVSNLIFFALIVTSTISPLGGTQVHGFRAIAVGSLSLFQSKRAMQAQVYLILSVVLTVNQEAYEELIHFQEPFGGLRKVQMPFPQQPMCERSTVWILQMANSLWIDQLQTPRVTSTANNPPS